MAGAAMVGCSGRGEAPEDEGSLVPPRPEDWWMGGGKYVVHSAVNTKRLASRGIVRARIDGSWRDVKVADLPDRFVRWSLNERIVRLEKLATVGFDPRDLDGPHNACVATYGGWERDSAFTLNTAYKGMGFAPLPVKMAQTLEDLEAARERVESTAGLGFMEQMKEKTRFLAGFYNDSSRFDLTKQVSLELLTTPQMATHTFLNMMANPIASASFLAYPTFEIRAVPQLLHPENPDLSARERHLIEYTNGIHNFVHGGDHKYMTCVYHVAEVYDDTPNEGGGGVRLV